MLCQLQDKLGPSSSFSRQQNRAAPGLFPHEVQCLSGGFASLLFLASCHSCCRSVDAERKGPMGTGRIQEVPVLLLLLGRLSYSFCIPNSQ